MSVNLQKNLDGLKTSFSLAKDEYYKTYPDAKLYPKVESYQQPYNRAKDIITSTNADLFVLENETRGKINKLSNEIESIDEKINEIKKTNEALELKLSNMEGTDEGAKVRFNNSRLSSYTSLYKTIFLTIVSFYTISKMRSV